MVKIMGTIWILIGIISTGYAKQCYEWYCRENTEEMFIQAERKFLVDMENWKHKQQADSTNECEYHLSSIAYWFAQIESWLGKWIVATLYNNWFSIKRWSGKYSYIWIDEYWYSKTSNFLKYPDPFLSALEFMHLYKYWYLCKLWIKSVWIYKMWTFVDDHITKRYHTSLISTINKFEKKYFSDWQSPDDHVDTSVLAILNEKLNISNIKILTWESLNSNSTWNSNTYIHEIKNQIFDTVKNAIEYISTLNPQNT